MEKLNNFREDRRFINEVMKEFLEKNFIETHKQCEQLLLEAQIKYPFTIKNIYEGLQICIKNSIDKTSLFVCLKFLGDLSLVGVNAAIAGEKLREAFIEAHKQLQYRN